MLMIMHMLRLGGRSFSKREGSVKEGGHFIKIASSVNKMMMIEEGSRGRGEGKRRQVKGKTGKGVTKRIEREEKKGKA
jgi:hypothetical protein